MYSRLLEALIAIGLVCAAWFYAGHRAVEQYKTSQEIVQAKADKLQQDKYNTLATSYEALRDKRESNAKVIVREVEKVVAGDIIYRNVCINADGLSIANAALSGAATSKPNDTVPTAE